MIIGSRRDRWFDPLVVGDTLFFMADDGANGIELWVCDVRKAEARRLTGPVLNGTGFGSFQWMPDSRRLLCQRVPRDRGAAPAEPLVPSGPVIRETSGRVAPVRTYQDLLQSAHDELLFEAPEAELERLEALVREEMEGAFELRVPLKVDVGRGWTWLEAH